MNKTVFVALLLIGLVALGLASRVPSASAAPAFEDPQICLNGKLLMVEPTTAPLEAWLDVGPGVRVDFNINHCGGDPSLPVFERSHVTHDGSGNWATLTIKTRKHTDVIVLWNGNTLTLNSGNDNWIVVSKRIN